MTTESPRGPRRTFTDTELDVELAGIRTSLELGGLEWTPEAEEIARTVLAGGDGKPLLNAFLAKLKAENGID